VKNVVYLNWLVDIDKIHSLVPEGVRVVDINGKTIFSILTYQHGHFRPVFADIFKFAFPSPLQSNWRLYIDSVKRTKVERTVLFIKNILNNKVFTLGTRLSSDAMLTHYTDEFIHCENGRTFTTEITPKLGSSPDLKCNLQHSETLNIPQELVDYFGSQQASLNYLCLQDYSITESPDVKGLCKAEIELPIDMQSIKPLSMQDFESKWLSAIVKGGVPFAFLIPSVDFKVVDEDII